MLCKKTAAVKAKAAEPTSSCCASKSAKLSNSVTAKTLTGIRYSATQLIDDLVRWLLLGLLFATAVKNLCSQMIFIKLGAMLVMIAMSIPMYICATASTPIAAGFIMAGISPGTALVFMMARPATNISTLDVIKNEMGSGVLIKYL
ncbi:permease [Colwellia sp. C1TZA3]|uniref:permease n=1 Tax=Colwellia sp. C1TZA3 TaxID=2508879 RepID=UPI001CB970D0|nr:permease [Colwellia sp. C1TZA3]